MKDFETICGKVAPLWKKLQDSKKIRILFTNSLLKGNNTWTILPDEKKFLIENSIEIEEIMTGIKG